jgi:hypothetical protein
MNFSINKWQRTVLIVGSLVFLVAAAQIFFDSYSERSPTIVFFLAILLGFLALSPRKEGEDFIPYQDLIVKNWRQTTIKLGILAAFGVLLFVIVAIGSSDYTSDAAASASYTATEAAADAAAYATEEPYGAATTSVEIPPESSSLLPPGASYLDTIYPTQGATASPGVGIVPVPGRPKPLTRGDLEGGSSAMQTEATDVPMPPQRRPTLKELIDSLPKQTSSPPSAQPSSGPIQDYQRQLERDPLAKP